MTICNKTAVITGAAKGIGKAIAFSLAQNGDTVVLIDVDRDNLIAAKKELTDSGYQAEYYVCDITDKDEVEAVMKDIEKRFGLVDILVNNAGIWKCDQGAFVSSESQNWIKKIKVNILGTMYCTHAVLPGMQKKQYGRIVNIGSVAGCYGNPNMVDYSTTKGAVIAFTKALAKEVAASGITVNTVSPGNIKLEGEKDNMRLSFIPRSGTPEECASLVSFLVSDEAAFISGQNYVIDGCRKV